MTMKWVFDLKEEDIYWCTADIGWVTGHSYIVYGPLAAGATVLMYEGAPNFPQNDRFWEIIEKYRVNIFYTAPTAIRTFIKWGEQWVKKHDLSSLRLLGTVGEPINPEAWMWYHKVIGGERCPIVDTWWQTETGGIMIAPMPGAIATKPGSATRPLPGVAAEVVTREGKPVGANQGGLLVIKRPWPGMLRTIFRDPERYRQQYFSQIEGVYFTGDGARRDEDGYFWIMGRVDDVINVSGHRLGTMEIESALVSHPAVAEAAVVGRPDEMKGQAVVAFVTLEGGRHGRRQVARRTAPARGQGDRRARAARRSAFHRLAAQDAQRQDHAAAAAPDRRGRRNARRHHDARRSLGARQAPRRRRLTSGADRSYPAAGGTIAILPAIVPFSISSCACASSRSGSTLPTTGLICPLSTKRIASISSPLLPRCEPR